MIIIIHLHVHSEYSLRDSTVKMEELITITKEMGFTAVAITDHGNMAGSFEFYTGCLKAGIKPIIGVEAYIVKDSEIKDKDEERFHLVLIAMNETGYKNLIKLVSEANINRFYYSPRIDFKLLRKYGEGIIAMTACAPKSLLYMNGHSDIKMITTYKILKSCVEQTYLEIMPHNFKSQKVHNAKMIEIANKMNESVVSTQDVHYLRKEDEKVHDILMAIQDRDPYGINSLYLCSKHKAFVMYKNRHGYMSKKIIMDSLEVSEEIANSIGGYNIPVEKFDYPRFTPTQNQLEMFT